MDPQQKGSQYLKPVFSFLLISLLLAHVAAIST